MTAAKNGSLSVVDLFLTKGADCSAKDQNGYTPLHHAIEYGRRKVALRLLQERLHLQEKTNSGETVMEIAQAMAT